MIYQNFIYGSYPSQSPVADAERTINWYPEQIESPGGKGPLVLYPTPGQSSYISASQITDVGTRAMLAMRGRTHAVVGQGVYELFASQTATRNATSITQDNYPAQIASNGPAGNQLLISSGTNGYSLNLSTNVLTQVLTGDATMVGMMDGYGVAFNIATSRYRLSNLNDFTTWDPTQFLARSIAPDPWQAMVIRNREIVLIGEFTGEVHYNAANFPFPFAPIPGAIFSYGTAAPFSAAGAGDQVIWLSQSQSGIGIVVGMTGYTPQRISTHAVETAIAGYRRNGTISDAEGLVYEDQGHIFYVLSFPSANATWVYDLTTKLWHERGTWNSAANRFDMWHPRVYCQAFGKLLVGERGTGQISLMDVATGVEANGDPIRRVRIGPALWTKPDRNRLRVSRLDLQLEPGLGVVTGQGSNPEVMLRISHDAKTWSSERRASAGPMGEYTTRVYWTRLGSSVTVWLPEITVSDPIPWRLLGASVEGDGFVAAKAA